MDITQLSEKFSEHFGDLPRWIVRAPGRVNLIGEHTDYNGGFVLPVAIDREVRIALRPREDRHVCMLALDFDQQTDEFSLDDIQHAALGWSNYVRGVADVLQKAGHTLTGADLLMSGDVPIGSGLSSSAALEVCAALAFQTASSFELGRVQMALACQRAENQFVGVKSGIMDQFISALGHEGHALLIDCLDLSYRNVPLPDGVTVMVCDTMKRRGLVDSEYNTRRAECEEATREMGVQYLREVSAAQFVAHESKLRPVVARRARHVITENARVLSAVEAAKGSDVAALGRLMDQSHVSMRDDFEISCRELDWMVEIARRQTGCYGSRLTGAGFGGCTVSLVAQAQVAAFRENVAREYEQVSGRSPNIYACQPMDGASLVA